MRFIGPLIPADSDSFTCEGCWIDSPRKGCDEGWFECGLSRKFGKARSGDRISPAFAAWCSERCFYRVEADLRGLSA